MKRLEKVEQLRRKVGYLNGRRKVFAMAELAHALGRSNPQEARSIADKAVERARVLLQRCETSAGSWREYAKMLAYALEARAACHDNKIDSGEDTRMFEEAAALLEECEDWKKLFDVLDLLALNHRQYGRLEPAHDAVERALAIAETQRITAKLSPLYAAHATILLRMKKKGEAELSIKQALAHIEHCRTAQEQLAACIVVGEYYYQNQQFDAAIDYYNKSRTLAVKTRNHTLAATACWQLNFCYHYTGRQELVLDVLTEGHERAREGGQAWMEAAFAEEIAGRLIKQGSFPRALEYWHRAEELFETLEDNVNRANVLTNIGFTQLDYEDQERGEYILRRALNLILSCAPHPLAMLCLVRIAACNFVTADEGDKILSFLTRAESQTAAYSGTDFTISICMARGITFIKQLRFAEARMALDEGLKHAHNHNMAYLTTRVLMLHAQLSLAENDADAADGYMAEVHKLADRDVSTNNRLRYHQLRMEISETRGDYHSAFNHLKALREFDRNTISKRSRDIVAGSIKELEFKRMRRDLNESRRRAEQLELENSGLNKNNHEKTIQLEYLKNALRDVRDDLRKDPHGGTGADGATAQQLLTSLNKALNTDITAPDSAYLSGDEDFIRRLGTAYPALSQTERKVCALIRAGTGSKDICRILHVSPRTIETYRYRIRRKMNLDVDTDLNLFVLNY